MCYRYTNPLCNCMNYYNRFSEKVKGFLQILCVSSKNLSRRKRKGALAAGMGLFSQDIVHEIGLAAVGLLAGAQRRDAIPEVGNQNDSTGYGGDCGRYGKDDFERFIHVTHLLRLMVLVYRKLRCFTSKM